MNSADLKTRLLCQGVRVPELMRTARRGGAGPAGGRYVVVEKMVVNCFVYGAAMDSDIWLEEEDELCVLVDRNPESTFRDRLPVHVVKDPYFYDLTTREGVPYKKIALLHGVDCLATTVYQRCVRWRTAPCWFCGIERSLEYGGTIQQKTPQQLEEVAEAAKKEGASHVTLTTGTVNTSDRGAFMLAECAAALKRTGLPVHSQLEPVPRTYQELLRDQGADTIGIHIETVDETLFEKICPSKNFSEFSRAWEDAVDIFGENQVSSYILVGLGEDERKTKTGIENMVQHGVIPFVVPFRPLPGTVLESHPLPSLDVVQMYSVWAAKKMMEAGIDPFKNKAGCVRCGACSSVKEYLRSM
ncbi:MAG: MSMEG_0568 family radical SAM protein [Theionarchaea archaeon]|nr:MSMEG_0568 family radical SAM protein [Theionarchaea archaeon]MBU7036959.1 MSMEG_0568 family radical SAM protein [Theionarchaea archaeon]